MIHVLYDSMQDMLLPLMNRFTTEDALKDKRVAELCEIDFEDVKSQFQDTVKSLYFMGALFSWFSWIPSTTNLHPQRIMLYNKQKLKKCL